MCRAKDIELKPAYGGSSLAYTRASLIDHTVGSVHTGFGLCALEQGGHVEKHVHSFEEGFYVLEGKPRIVLRDIAYETAPGTCGVVPVGVPHAWIAPENEGAKWIDMLAPQPRPQGTEQDTFFLGEPDVLEYRELDIRDPRNKNFFKMAENDIDLDKLKAGSREDTPKVSVSMATALLAYSGIAVKMLVDHRLDAHLMTMFMVEYQPGGVAHPHDHPLEET
jgi:quercetin dioxygenase-like cupin family protein